MPKYRLPQTDNARNHSANTCNFDFSVILTYRNRKYSTNIFYCAKLKTFARLRYVIILLYHFLFTQVQLFQQSH